MCKKIKLLLKETGYNILNRYSTALCNYAGVFALVATWIAFIIGSGLKLHQQQRNVDVEYLYAPLHARAKYEFATIEEHWPITGDRFIPGRSFNFRQSSQAIFAYKNGSSLMDLRTMTALWEFNKWVTKSLYGQDGSRKRYYFKDLCLTWLRQCSFTNQHLRTLKIVLGPNVTADVTYPKWKVFGFSSLYMGTLLGGVQLYNGTNKVKSFTSIVLVYYLNYLDPILNVGRLSWEKRFAEAIEQRFINNDSSPFDVSYLHSRSLDNGFTEVPALTASRLMMTINILITFSIINCCRLCLRAGRVTLDINGSKPLLGLAGIATSVCGVITAMGMYLYSGGESNGIFVVVPFLTLAIGLDDTFVIIAAWHRTGRNLPVTTRISMSIADSAHSITITSLTSCLSFIVGMLSRLPAAKLFCAVTAMAIFFNYIYQITFFPALLYVSGIVEVHGVQRILYFLRLPYQPKKGYWRKDIVPKRLRSRYVTQDPFILLIRKYSEKVLQSPPAKILTLLLYVIYIIPAFYGITELKQGLQVHRLVLQDNHFTKFCQTYWSSFYSRGQQVEIVVNNAPNLTCASERQKLKAMVSSVEGTDYTMGGEGTQFFLPEYEKYLRVNDLQAGDDSNVWQRGLYSWCTMNAYRRMVYPDMLWEKVPPDEPKACRKCNRILKSFRFRIGLLSISTTDNQRAVAKLVRSLSDQYPEYNITTYHPEWVFVDQYNIIVSNTLVSLSTAVASMAVVATVFFRDFFCIIWTILSIMSINIGVIGYMALWGVHLECVSMLCIIMSIGLSVDYTAHVVHGFRVATGSIDERITASLTSLGIPVLQGGLSTLLGVLAIGTVYAYLLQVFFKVTTLAVCFGLLHACVFIPIALLSSATLVTRYCSKGPLAEAKSIGTHRKP